MDLVINRMGKRESRAAKATDHRDSELERVSREGLALPDVGT